MSVNIRFFHCLKKKKIFPFKICKIDNTISNYWNLTLFLSVRRIYQINKWPTLPIQKKKKTSDPLYHKVYAESLTWRLTPYKAIPMKWHLYAIIQKRHMQNICFTNAINGRYILTIYFEKKFIEF